MRAAEARRPVLRMPDFLIIGAAKSGTTWLSHNLGRHPEIGVAPVEVNYFSRFHARWSEDRYRAVFDGADHRVRMGEKSNSYMTVPGTAERIHARLPGVQLIALLRNPVERAYSSYCMQYDRGRASGDIAAVLDPVSGPLPHIFANGDYAAQLEPYLRRFPRERLFVTLFDDVRRSPHALYRRLTDFLDVSPLVPEGIDRPQNEKNAANDPRTVAYLRWWIAHSPLQGTKLLDHLRGAARRAGVRDLFRPAARVYPPLTPEIRARLLDYYAPGIARLEASTGLDLSVWRTAA